jgi:hypothetical protein
MLARLARLVWPPVAVAAALLFSACGGSVTQSATTTASFKGTTIDLISSGAAGSTHDLDARAVASLLGQYLHATVDVIDMPGGGQLKAWNYVSQATPNGLTIGTIDIQGVMANVWENVPGQNFNPQRLTMLGGLAGGIAGGAKIMFTNTNRPPFQTIYTLVRDHTTRVVELGSVGDVSGPLLFKLYKVPYEDLTSYPDASAELQGLIRGDGQLSVKTWGGGWASLVESGRGYALLEFSMRPHWKIDRSVPTLYDLFKRDPLPAAQELPLEVDAAGLDAGTAFFGPPGIGAAKVALLRKAFDWAIHQREFISRAQKASISQYYESPAQEIAALAKGLAPATITEMRKYVPLSPGVAS